MNGRPGFIGSAVVWFVATLWTAAVHSQVSPSAGERAGYDGLLAAATRGHADEIGALAANGADVGVRDAHGRTPLHVATYGAHHAAMRALVAAGSDPNALEDDRYDIVTIAAVADDLETLATLIRAGANLQLVDREGRTPLELARLHGHDTMVHMLIRAGAQ